MSRGFRILRLVTLLAGVLAATCPASGALVSLGGQVNDDPANMIDPSQDAGLVDVAGGRRPGLVEELEIGRLLRYPVEVLGEPQLLDAETLRLGVCGEQRADEQPAAEGGTIPPERAPRFADRVKVGHRHPEFQPHPPSNDSRQRAGCVHVNLSPAAARRPPPGLVNNAGVCGSH